MPGVKRESKSQFWQRVEREGRLTQARVAEAELVRQGLSWRQVQRRLVGSFQPLDGTPTRAWPTPNSWKCGRRKSSPLERFENDLHWAYEHLDHVKSEDAPTAQKRSLLLLAEKKPAEFNRRYHKALPNITRRQEAKEEERQRRIEAQDEERDRRVWERERKRQEAERVEQDQKAKEAKRKRLYRQKKRQQKEAEEQAEQERQRQQAEMEARTARTREVLSERRTKIETLHDEVCGDGGIVGRGTADYPIAAWPEDPDQAVLTSPEAIAWQKELDAAKIAAQDEARRLAALDLGRRRRARKERVAKKRRAATQAVLDERRKREGAPQHIPARDAAGIEVSASYMALEPDWPADADPEVTGSPEAKAWLAELKETNTRRQAEAERRAAAELAERLSMHAARLRQMRLEQQRRQEILRQQRPLREAQERQWYGFLDWLQEQK